ncbi:MAG: hypothetical protein P9L91_09125 [Candidatus Zophobacter franzmannii]|nr:hypothetical protein [Candidatus Zophobacter franzmannii]
MLKKAKRFYNLYLILFILLTTACERNKLATAESIYKRRKFISAINLYDNFLKFAQNGAYKTEAQLSRSDSYYELTKLAVEKENYILAERLSVLANSKKADKLLAEAYYRLAEDQFNNSNIDEGWNYFRKIVEFIPTSVYVPEILFRRIKYDLEIAQDYSAALPNYMELYQHFPDNQFELSARKMLDKFTLSIVADAYALRDSTTADRALEFLFEIEQYPIGKHKDIYITISHLYEEKADLDIRFEKYGEARNEFQLAIKYHLDGTDRINEKIENYAEDFISRGDEMVGYRKFNNAISLYKMAYEIIPDYVPATIKINEVIDNIDAVKQAQVLVEKGNIFENSREFSKALPLYEEAYGLDPLSEYRDRIYFTKNMISAEKNPIEFVSKIILDYQNGLMDKRINKKIEYLQTQYEDEDVQGSDWKIMRSTGRFKYEVRYDIFTPNRDFFYVWQVNVKDKSIKPLNKLSEELMEK